MKERAEKMNDGICPLCRSETIADYQFWRIIPNNYPYDRVAAVHHMIVPKRHTTYDEITSEEQAELDALIKTDLNKNYNFLQLALPKGQSIPNHLHYHLIVPLDFD